MHKNMYLCMVDCGVAVKWADGPIWFNCEGEVVETLGEAFRKKSEYELIQPDKVIFVDEVGCNTSQKNDGNVGREKFLVRPTAKHESGQHSRTAISQSPVLWLQLVSLFYVQLYWHVKQ